MIDGDTVRRLRKERGYSLRVLAALVTDRTGSTVSHQALHAIEEGGADLSLTRTVALASALGVGISDILLPHEQRAKVGA